MLGGTKEGSFLTVLLTTKVNTTFLEGSKKKGAAGAKNPWREREGHR